MEEVNTVVNVCAIFFPRLTLWIAWLNNCIPANPFPFWGDFFMTLFVPNVLLAVYNFSCGQNVWGAAHLFIGVCRIGVEAKTSKR